VQKLTSPLYEHDVGVICLLQTLQNGVIVDNNVSF